MGAACGRSHVGRYSMGFVCGRGKVLSANGIDVGGGEEKEATNRISVVAEQSRGVTQ